MNVPLLLEFQYPSLLSRNKVDLQPDFHPTPQQKVLHKNLYNVLFYIVMTALSLNKVKYSVHQDHDRMLNVNVF